MKAIRDIGMSSRESICKLHIICDHVQSLYLAETNLLGSQNAVANKPDDNIKTSRGSIARL